MPTPLRTTAVLTLALCATTLLSIQAVQAGQDRRGGDRGRTQRGGAQAPPSKKSIYFNICDHDGNQWISFREANYSLNFDRHRFRGVDTNSDGKITANEFAVYYAQTKDRAGAFMEPIAHDAAASGANTGGDAAAGAAPPKAKQKAQTLTPEIVLKHFRSRNTPGTDEYALRLPPMIRGPVHYFDRLDIDEDGQVTTADLEWLARSVHINTRLAAVIGVLDADDDGGVSKAELRASMGDS